jgi:hypothetical protein
MLPHNNDFDEENRNTSGVVVTDAELNASTSHIFGGNRTVGDEEIKYATLHMTAPTVRGEWQIDLPETVMMWQWWERGNEPKPWPHWGMMTEGYSLPDGMPAMYWFRIEGLDVSSTVTITVTVRAVDAPAVTKSDAVNVTVNASPTPPVAPVNLQATTISSTQIDLAWDPAAGAPAGTKYRVWRDTTPGFRLYSEYPRFPERINLLPEEVTGTTFSDTALAGPGPYYYRVTAVLSGSDSPPSSEVSATLDSPGIALGVLGVFTAATGEWHATSRWL